MRERNSKQGSAAPVTLVLGEPIVAEARAREILDVWIPADRQVLDLEILRAGQDDLGRVAPSLAQVGMFSAARAVWIRNLGQELADDSAILLTALEKGLPSGAMLLATSSKLDQRSRLYKWFVAHGSVEDLSMTLDKRGRMLDDDLAAFIRERFRSAGVAMPPAAVVAAVRQRVGTDLGDIAHEVDKLVLACAAAGSITPLDVSTHVRDQSEAWVFDLTDAISERRPARAAALVERLLLQGEAPIRLVAVLATHVADLIEAAHETPAVPPAALRNSGAFIRDYFPKLSSEARNRFKSGYRAFYVFRGASAYRPDELRSFHRALVEADLALKSSRLLPAHLLTEIIQRACASPDQRAPIP